MNLKRRVFFMKETIILDVDGVLLSWNSNILKFLTAKGYKITKDIIEDIANNKWIEMKRLDSLINGDFVKEYHNSRHCAQLPVVYNKLPMLLKILSETYELVTLTSFSNEEKAKKNRIRNLEDCFGNIFESHIVLNYGESKESSLKKLNKVKNVRLFIDDHHKNIEAGFNTLGTDKVFWLKSPNDWDIIFKDLTGISLEEKEAA